MKKVKILLIVLLMFSAFMTAFSQDAEYYFELGYIESEAHNYPKAIEYYTMAISIDPNFARAYNNRGNVYSVLEKFEDAISDYTKVISIDDPIFTIGAYINRGLAYYDLRKYEEAISDYTTAINIDSSYGIAFYNRGLAYYDLGYKNNACKDWQGAYSLGIYSTKNLLDKYCK